MTGFSRRHFVGGLLATAAVTAVPNMDAQQQDFWDTADGQTALNTLDVYLRASFELGIFYHRLARDELRQYHSAGYTQGHLDQEFGSTKDQTFWDLDTMHSITGDQYGDPFCYHPGRMPKIVNYFMNLPEDHSKIVAHQTIASAMPTIKQILIDKLKESDFDSDKGEAKASTEQAFKAYIEHIKNASDPYPQDPVGWTMGQAIADGIKFGQKQFDAELSKLTRKDYVGFLVYHATKPTNSLPSIVAVSLVKEGNIATWNNKTLHRISELPHQE